MTSSTKAEALNWLDYCECLGTWFKLIISQQKQNDKWFQFNNRVLVDRLSTQQKARDSTVNKENDFLHG